MGEEVIICDTTLRDGEQMPGVIFSKKQKIDLAKKISNLGAKMIDLMPAVSQTEREITEELVGYGLQNKILASTMMRKEHIDLARNCSVRDIALFASISDIHLNKKLGITRKENLEKSVKYVNYAKEQGLNVNFAGEDSSRADFKYLVSFINYY